MTRWIRQLLCTDGPSGSAVRPRRTTLGLQQLEDRETPAMFLVTTTADSGAGSLRAAVTQANTNPGADTITFQAGLGPVTLTSDQLSLTDTSGTTTISGPSGGTQTVRRSTAVGTPLFRVFSINSGVTANLSQLTITDGNAPSTEPSGSGVRNAGNLTVVNSVISGNGSGSSGVNGAGLYTFGGTLAVVGTTITGNGSFVGDTAANGAGLYNFQGNVTVTSSVISGNVASFSTGSGGVGGGIFNNAGIMTVASSTVSGNSALHSAGISNSGGTMTVTNSTISGNAANNTLGGSGSGGGISNGGILTLSGSTISGNSARNQAGNATGGGLFSNGTLTVSNSTFSGNEAIVSSGGGVSIVGGTATFTNVTITGNRSNDRGGGLFRSNGTVTLGNTLITGNFRGPGTSTRDDASGAVASASANNLIGNGTNLTGITNGTSGNQIGTAAAPINPLLQPMANNGGLTSTHSLGLNSPALGKGSTTVANYQPFDQRGAARDNGTPDIGAFEVNHPLATVGAPTTLAGLYQPKPSASANEAFVKGLYQSTLLRAPDAAGLAGWIAQLNGGTSRSTVANGLVNSTENRRNQVTFFYRYFLSREPDTAGLNGWVAQLQSGTDEGQVMTGFILSNEFSGQNNNSQFVNLMYYALLSRQADTAGFNGWVSALNGGMSRATVVNAFLRSEEGINRVVDGMFQTYLKRYGTAGDLGAYRTFLNSNTFGQAAIVMLASAEFFTSAGNHLS
jgi:hypothetical protein